MPLASCTMAGLKPATRQEARNSSLVAHLLGQLGPSAAVQVVEEPIRKGRNIAIQVMLLTQQATGDAISTRIRGNWPGRHQLRQTHRGRAGGRAGERDPPAR
jgi:hypothetical protein